MLIKQILSYTLPQSEVKGCSTPSIKLIKINLNDNQTLNNTSSSHGFRIKEAYWDNNQVFNMFDNKNLTRAVNITKKYFNMILNVTQLNNQNTTLKNSTNIQKIFPPASTYFNSGYNASQYDSVVFIRHLPTNAIDSYSAAMPLQIYKWPQYGILFVSPYYFSFDSNITFDKKVKILIHQFTHIYAFNYQLFDHFYKSYESLLTRNISEVIDGSGQYYIKTESVKSYMQNYFNCTSAIGAPILIEGQNVHWKGQVFLNDYMVKQNTKAQHSMSLLNLKLFKDTGFYYKVSQNYYDNITYGKNKGCNFILGVKLKQDLEYCDFIKNQNQCNFYGRNRGKCIARNSTDQFSGFVQAFEQQDICGSFSSCALLKQKQNDIKGASFCIPFYCDSNNQVKLKNNPNSYSPGQVINYNYLNYHYIQFPNHFDNFCALKQCNNSCGGFGFCINGSCYISLSCSQAIQNCNDCNNSIYPFKCKSCKPNYTLTLNQQQCILSQANSTISTCFDLINFCSACTFSNTSLYCSTCSTNTTNSANSSNFSNNECTYIYLSINIANCQPTSIRINIKGQYKCLSCQYGYFPGQNYSSCIKCSSIISGCQSCYREQTLEKYNSSTVFCLKCFYTNIMDLASNNNCSRCQPLSFNNQTNNKCQQIKCDNNNNCSNCSNNLCLSCTIRTSSEEICLQQNIKQCLIDSKKIICVPGCQKCYCYSNIGGICSKSQQGFRIDANTEVYTCPQNCKQCSSQSQCDICNQFSFYQNSTSTNQFECINNAYYNCVLENRTSKTCQICKQGYYSASSSSISCLSCGSNCAKCNNALSCLKCLSGFTLSLATNNCQRCEFNCKTCLSDNRLECTSCNLGFFLNNTSCQVCPTNCLKCSSTQICTNCIEGFTLDSQLKCFQKCKFPCVTCYDGFPSKCLTITLGFNISNEINKKQSDMSCNSQDCFVCPLGFKKVFNSSSNTNIYCTAITIENCLAVSTKTNLCSNCQQGYYLNKKQSTCYKCSTGCEKCLSQTYCQVCSLGYTKAVRNTQDILLNGQCLKCSSQCQTCIGSIDICTSCKNGYQLIFHQCLNNKKIQFSLTLADGFQQFKSSSKLESIQQTIKSLFDVAFSGIIKRMKILSIAQGSVIIKGIAEIPKQFSQLSDYKTNLCSNSQKAIDEAKAIGNIQSYSITNFSLASSQYENCTLISFVGQNSSLLYLILLLIIVPVIFILFLLRKKIKRCFKKNSQASQNVEQDQTHQNSAQLKELNKKINIKKNFKSQNQIISQQNDYEKTQDNRDKITLKKEFGINLQIYPEADQQKTQENINKNKFQEDFEINLQVNSQTSLQMGKKTKRIDIMEQKADSFFNQLNQFSGK